MADLPRIPCEPLGIVWGASGSKVVMEVFIDICCPFSKRIFDRLIQEVAPKYEPKGLKLVFQLVPQPWHPQSCLLTEAAIAANLVDSSKTQDMLKALFDQSSNFYDVETYNKSRTQIYEEFGDIADSIGLPKDQYTQKFKLDTSNGQKNGGNGVTRVMKFYVKQHRQLGVHVTPTIRVNGLLCDSSSGWTLEQWSEFLDPLFARAGL